MKLMVVLIEQKILLKQNIPDKIILYKFIIFNYLRRYLRLLSDNYFVPDKIYFTQNIDL
jgi:hypothetical protein